MVSSDLPRVLGWAGTLDWKVRKRDVGDIEVIVNSGIGKVKESIKEVMC